MKVEILKVGYLRTNCYFLIKDRDVIIIDPGEEASKIKEKISDYNLKAILVTHDHFDHVDALGEILSEYNVPVNPKKVEGFNYQVIETPGHTEDSVTFYFPEESMMFTGDFIFYDTIGRTDLEGGNHETMLKSLEMIKSFPDDIAIYPGHGQSTNLGDEKLNFDRY